MKPTIALLLTVLALFAFATNSAAANTRRELMDMALAGRFEDLDAALSSLQKDYERSPDPVTEGAVQMAYVAFRNTKAGLPERLAQWRSRMPDSCAASLALGDSNLSLGEALRGTQWAEKTSAVQFHAMEDHLHEAVSDFEAAGQCDASMTMAWAGLIEAASMLGDQPLLKRSLDRGLAAQPSSFEVRESYLAALAPKWGGSMEAVDAFVAASKGALAPAAASRLDALAEIIHADPFIDAGRYDDAEPILERAVQRSGEWNILLARGENLARLHRTDEALADFNRALAARPESSPIYEQRARALVAAGKADEALTDVDAALVFNDQDPNLLGYRSWILAQELNRPADAVADAKAALVLGSQRAFSWVWLGSALRRAKADPEEVRQAYLHAISLDPEETAAWYGYGSVLYDELSGNSLDAFDHYVYLCQSSPLSRCQAGDLDWLRFLVHQPATYLNWPRVLLRPHLMGLLL